MFTTDRYQSAHRLPNGRQHTPRIPAPIHQERWRIPNSASGATDGLRRANGPGQPSDGAHRDVAMIPRADRDVPGETMRW